MTKPQVLGRLAAALEHLGYLDNRGIAVAVTSPISLITPLGRATASGEKARDILTPIVAEFPVNADPFPANLPNQAQSDFWIGYHQQRAEFRAGRLPKLPDSEPDLDARYEFRIEPELKVWVKANGGDRLIRALLREARKLHEG